MGAIVPVSKQDIIAKVPDVSVNSGQDGTIKRLIRTMGMVGICRPFSIVNKGITGSLKKLDKQERTLYSLMRERTAFALL